MSAADFNPTRDPSMDPITWFRTQFDASNRWIHVNNAGQAPMCRPARKAFEHWARRMAEEGAHSVLDLVRDSQVARTHLASFLGAQPTELAFFQSAAGAISQVAFGLNLKAGDEIITWDQEYPSNLYPWSEAARRFGAKLVVVPSEKDLSTPVDRLLERVTPRTCVIATSWVQYRSGAITDLQRLAKEARAKGIFTCADIIQGAGLLPFDFKAMGIDAACGGSHKWMLSSHGAGFLLLREEHLERLDPLMVGAMTFGSPDDLPDPAKAKARPDALRFEPGSKAFVDIVALGAAARLLSETGIDRVAQEAEWLSRTLLHGLRERGYLVASPHGSHHRGSILNFSPGPDSPLKDQAAIEERLTSNGVGFSKRPPGIRIAPHAFNTKEEIEKVLSILS